MLDRERMTRGDAQHTLEVYKWITQHLQEISELAENTERAGVSAKEAQERFHEEFTQLESMRFLPVRITILTDEDALAMGRQTEPNVLLHLPLDRNTFASVLSLPTLDLSEVAKIFGISADEQTWRLVYEEQNNDQGISFHPASPAENC